MAETMTYGVVGSGSWATALVKILTDNGHRVHWWVRNERQSDYIRSRRHNPQYLPTAYLNVALLQIAADVNEVLRAADVIVLAVPSAYIRDVLAQMDKETFRARKIVSAIKGIVPGPDVLLNEYLEQEFGLPLEHYFAVLGPCHAEEVAAEKLSYLTFSGVDDAVTAQIAEAFRSPYINTITNHDILGVQYAAVLKNIYALGAGIAHGLEYGDNFLSVYIANSADEMAGFLQKAGIEHIEVGKHEEHPITHKKEINYAASVYLGDLLVTCYSPYSRNRTFGAMIGKGYTVQSAQLEMNMVAEGYNACKCMFHINRRIGAEMPIAETIYRILWEKEAPAAGFETIEGVLV
ncbi:NAD(P)H-dependent glycerol-3-phosphate dehydrogenase [Flaviaesturariibacter amylovorans]|uniref:Glycerol-3-phosphate dehydrogenase [NAD(P)+] n=1 Tax=Flaviaesturariibacter amylovorans TaxID=1084520 RepID=A0ABP8GCR5_9BACT